MRLTEQGRGIRGASQIIFLLVAAFVWLIGCETQICHEDINPPGAIQVNTYSDFIAQDQCGDEDIINFSTYAAGPGSHLVLSFHANNSLDAFFTGYNIYVSTDASSPATWLAISQSRIATIDNPCPEDDIIYDSANDIFVLKDNLLTTNLPTISRTSYVLDSLNMPAKISYFLPLTGNMYDGITTIDLSGASNFYLAVTSYYATDRIESTFSEIWELNTDGTGAISPCSL